MRNKSVSIPAALIRAKETAEAFLCWMAMFLIPLLLTLAVI